MPHCCIWGFQPCHYSSTNIQVGNLGHWTCCMPRAVWFLYQTRHALAYPTATNRWCCQLINYLERLALYGTCLKRHWTPFSLQSYMSHSVMHTMGASQAPVLHLFTLYTSDSGRTSGPATCSGSRMTLHLWAASVRGRRLSARTWPTPPSVWGDPPATNTDRTKELVVDLCRQKTLEMWTC